ncbi:MAG: NAD(P)H-dependent oxidoreductase subunit E [Actinomycetia bacterium]|nr:NAD(P)H-dependent oxidoreductase subunit E [Actinomycetes bacterium]
MTLSERTVSELREIPSRYPDGRSAILPMLHLAQSDEGLVTGEAMDVIGEILDLTTAQVTAVASFYTMYRLAGAGGEHHIGVCINTMCGLLGGDAIYEEVSKRLSIGNHETSADGKFTLEKIECQAACTYAPVVTVDWEFFDQMDLVKMMDVIDRLTAGEEVVPTRGPAVRGWRATERTLAGMPDGLGDAGGGADAVMLAGLKKAHELGESAPPPGEGAK